MRQSEPGETVFWLVALIALPVADVALVIGCGSLGVLSGVPAFLTAGYLVGLVLAVVLTVVILRRLGERSGATTGRIAAAAALCFLVALLALAILVVGVVAPAVS